MSNSSDALRKLFDGEELERARRVEHWRAWESATYWIDAAFLALHGKRLTGEAFETNEAAYMKIVGKCRDAKITMGAFSQALGHAAIALQTETRDFLGHAFMELCANEHLGQFFTPPEVASLIVRLCGPIEPRADGRPLLIHEPAAGVGALLLAKAEYLREQGIDFKTDVHFVAWDLDQAAARACFIQLELAGISAVVVHGNTLTQEIFNQWPTTAALLNSARLHPLPLAAE